MNYQLYISLKSTQIRLNAIAVAAATNSTRNNGNSNDGYTDSHESVFYNHDTKFILRFVSDIPSTFDPICFAPLPPSKQVSRMDLERIWREN